MNKSEQTIFTVRPSFLAYPGLVFIWGWFVFPLFIVLWRVMTNSYRLTSQRIILQQGFISRQTQEIELYRIKGVSLKQSFWDRLLGVGDVEIFCTDDGAGTSSFIHRIRNPQGVKERIREQCAKARGKEKIMVTEAVQG